MLRRRPATWLCSASTSGPAIYCCTTLPRQACIRAWSSWTERARTRQGPTRAKGKHIMDRARETAPGPSMGMSGLRPCRLKWEGGAAACRLLQPAVTMTCGSCVCSAVGCSRGEPDAGLLHGACPVSNAAADWHACAALLNGSAARDGVEAKHCRQWCATRLACCA